MKNQLLAHVISLMPGFIDEAIEEMKQVEGYEDNILSLDAVKFVEAVANDEPPVSVSLEEAISMFSIMCAERVGLLQHLKDLHPSQWSPELLKHISHALTTSHEAELSVIDMTMKGIEKS